MEETGAGNEIMDGAGKGTALGGYLVDDVVHGLRRTLPRTFEGTVGSGP